MILKHSLIYLLARGIPGLINFLAIVIYTRLLDPTEYGRYAVVLASVGLANAFLFQWLRLGVTRFLQFYSNRDKSLVFLSSIFACFIVIVILSAFFTGISILMFSEYWQLWVLGILLLWAQAWFELSLEIFRSQLSPNKYGVISMCKSLLALCIGIMFVLFGWGEIGLLLGLSFGLFLSSFLFARYQWRGIRFNLLDRRIVKSVLSYGLPLTSMFAMSFIINSSDRILLNWFSGTYQTGLYSVTYDLSQQTLILLMTIVNLAAFPLVIRALESDGIEVAREQLNKNTVMLFFVGIPATAVLLVLGPNIVNIVFGDAYRETAYVIMPLIVIAAFIQGSKSYYLDLAFHLGKRTGLQVWTVFLAAIVNIFLNLWWIPKWGVIGAANATICAFFIGSLSSWALGRRSFPLPFPFRDILKIIIITIAMVFVLWQVKDYQGVFALSMQIFLGIMVCITGAWVLNISHFRILVSRIIVRKLRK